VKFLSLVREQELTMVSEYPGHGGMRGWLASHFKKSTQATRAQEAQDEADKPLRLWMGLTLGHFYITLMCLGIGSMVAHAGATGIAPALGACGQLLCVPVLPLLQLLDDHIIAIWSLMLVNSALWGLGLMILSYRVRKWWARWHPHGG
jgi:hypothetical protein